jgi:hypothetical protein
MISVLPKLLRTSRSSSARTQPRRASGSAGERRPHAARHSHIDALPALDFLLDLFLHVAPLARSAGASLEQRERRQASTPAAPNQLSTRPA